MDYYYYTSEVIDEAKFLGVSVPYRSQNANTSQRKWTHDIFATSSERPPTTPADDIEDLTGLKFGLGVIVPEKTKTYTNENRQNSIMTKKPVQSL